MRTIQPLLEISEKRRKLWRLGEQEVLPQISQVRRNGPNRSCVLSNNCFGDSSMKGGGATSDFIWVC